MPLKRLEIQGFKSFAEKTEFQFNPGVTIVVGPNGSGKSNVADAIRWVLGEQSAKSLRGAKMEDIIFSGSDKKKPLGMAEVSITLDNSNGLFPIEYNEIRVTRRVYRSGESDYLINKTPCRLKDIHELFTDTGVGKEGYSIIGQGKIDEILSTKSEDRRVLIEEAAGIVKYRNRKAEAVRKLTDTEQNLTRIKDIIIELETQVDPLAEQAEKAQQFLDYKEELSALEINLLINQLAEIKSQSSTAKDRTENLQKEVTSAETLHATQESRIEELRLTVSKLDEAIAEIQQKIYDLGSEVEKIESGIKISLERDKGLAEQKFRLDKEIEQIKEKLSGLQEEYAGDENHLHQLEAKIKEISSKVGQNDDHKIQLTANINLLQNHIESQKTEIIDLLNLLAGQKNEVKNLALEESGYHKQIHQLTAEIEKLNEEVNGIKQKAEDTRHMVKEQDNQVKSIEDNIARNQLAKADLNNRLDKVNKKIGEVNNQIQQNQSRHKILNEMQQHLEGFQKGVKEVLMSSRNGSLKGISGVVAELLKVPAKYESAVEVALGGSLQNIVTLTDNDAKVTIEYLKKNNLGRATFLPLNAISPAVQREDEKKASKMPGAFGFATDLVSFDEKYRKIFAYLLGRTVVVQSVEDAVKIARQCHYRVRLVTLEGDIISPGGSVTGGSYSRKGSNLLGRAREIEALEEQIKELTSAKDKLLQEYQQISNEITTRTGEIDNLNQQSQQIIINKTAIAKDIEQILMEEKRLIREIQVATQEKENIQQELVRLKSQENETQLELTTLEEKDLDIKELIKQSQEELNRLISENIRLEKEITAQKVELASLQQEKLSQAQSLLKYLQTKEEYQHSIHEKELAVADIGEKSAQLTRENELLQKELKVLIQDKQDKADKLQDVKAERQQKNQDLANIESQNKEGQKKLAVLQNELRAAEVKEARLEMETENYLARLDEEHGLSYEEAILKRTDIENKKAVNARIKELKAFINGLGVVNIGAIDEYTRIKERYDFLQVQFNDLEEARQSLYQVIAEMDEIMVQRFAESFTIINRNFADVFGELFGGGKAELQLTDAANLLETGVEIMAQPPGKKPQHLSLLSGGERALTAIALLFAILRAKPSPFCVLDEIEAALDEANVSRFADFLKEFATKTQFLVISHRKGTMEVADTLYGITIDDTGISKTVSLRLASEEEKVS